MDSKYIPLTPELYQYVVAHSGVLQDDVLTELRARTEALGPISAMLVPREQGTFLTLMALGVTNALEIGTFTGYSSSCIARGLAPGARLLCLDISEEWTNIAREFWIKGGVDDRIELRVGPAADSLKKLLESSDETFDFVFIDADKPGYDTYYELVLPRVRLNGLIIFDNMLWDGRVIDPNANDDDTVAIRALNDKLAKDSRVFSVLLPFADGLHICRKL